MRLRREVTAVGYELAVAQLNAVPLDLDDRDAFSRVSQDHVDLMVTAIGDQPDVGEHQPIVTEVIAQRLDDCACSSSLGNVRSAKSSGTSRPTGNSLRVGATSARYLAAGSGPQHCLYLRPEPHQQRSLRAGGQATARPCAWIRAARRDRASPVPAWSPAAVVELGDGERRHGHPVAGESLGEPLQAGLDAAAVGGVVGRMSSARSGQRSRARGHWSAGNQARASGIAAVGAGSTVAGSAHRGSRRAGGVQLLRERLDPVDQVLVGRLVERLPQTFGHLEQLLDDLVGVAGGDGHVDAVEAPAQRLSVVDAARR